MNFSSRNNKKITVIKKWTGEFFVIKIQYIITDIFIVIIFVCKVNFKSLIVFINILIIVLLRLLRHYDKNNTKL